MTRVFVKPRAGLSPRDPDNPGRRIPPEGMVAKDSRALRRMEQQGDVDLTPAPETPEASPAAVPVPQQVQPTAKPDVQALPAPESAPEAAPIEGEDPLPRVLQQQKKKG